MCSRYLFVVSKDIDSGRSENRERCSDAQWILTRKFNRKKLRGIFILFTFILFYDDYDTTSRIFPPATSLRFTSWHCNWLLFTILKENRVSILIHSIHPRTFSLPPPASRILFVIIQSFVSLYIWYRVFHSHISFYASIRVELFLEGPCLRTIINSSLFLSLSLS